MSRIDADELNVVNRAVWAVRRKMDEMSEKRDLGYSYWVSDSTGKAELSGLVVEHLMSVMPETYKMYEETVESGSVGFVGIAFKLYQKATMWTLCGVMCRESSMSESPKLRGMSGPCVSYYWSEKALRYEMSVLSMFSRWSDMDHLGEVSDWSDMSEPSELYEMGV